jgi:hypothetical protein
LPFFYRRWIYAAWSKKCLHCSWKKWDEFDPMVDPKAPNFDSDYEGFACLNCGHHFPNESESCVECGWSYTADLPSSNPMDRTHQ